MTDVTMSNDPNSEKVTREPTDEVQDDVPTVDDFLEQMGHLPGYQETNELIGTLLKQLHDQDEAGFWFTDVKLTWIVVRHFKVQKTRMKGNGGMEVRLKPAIGFHDFWYPHGAPVPALAFKMQETDSEHSEWWTEIIHPRLVAAGPEHVNRHIADWIFHRIREQDGHLDTLLKKLRALRDAGQLSWTWPQCFDVEPGRGWGADPDDRVPAVSAEEPSPIVGQLYPDE